MRDEATRRKYKDAHMANNDVSENRTIGTVCAKHIELGGLRYKRDNGCVGCKRDAFGRYKEGPQRDVYLARMRESTNARNAALKKVVFEGYGNKCSLCGIADPDVLTIDHVDGDGGEHRKELNINCVSRHAATIKVYRIIQNEQFPPRFRLLCFNCNYKEYIVRKRAARANLQTDTSEG